MIVSYAACAPPSFSYDHCFRIFFIQKCFFHKFRCPSDSVKSLQAGSLNQIYKVMTSCRPRCFLTDCKCLFRRMRFMQYTHLCMNCRTKFQFWCIYFQPFKYFFFFRTYTVQKTTLYVKSQYQQQPSQSKRTRMESIINRNWSISNNLFCMI